MAVALAVAVVLVRPAPVAADPATSPADHDRSREATVVYRPPVTGPVVDHFRPPPNPYAEGNRGVDYETVPGAPVAAAADGEVVFAGQVAGTLHVVVLHADGIRTSYSFLQSVGVHRGDRVTQGQPLGTSAGRLHFGARVGDTYVDPLGLFAAGPPDVHLVPDDDRRPASEAHERSRLLEGLAGLARWVRSPTTGAVDWARDKFGVPRVAARSALSRFRGEVTRLGGIVSYARDLHPAVIGGRALHTVAHWYSQRRDCTPAGVTPAPLRPGQHLAVTVAGFGSSTGDRAIGNLDTAALGYGPDDVRHFSYAGGTTPENRYDGRVTSQDIRISARRLRQLLVDLGRERPGVPVDILAHSQGGIVARQALAMESDPGDGDLPPINAVVLLGVPNTGADLATAGVMVGGTRSGAFVQDRLAEAMPDEADYGGPSVTQLAEASVLLARLNRTPLPPGVRVTSIGARTDPIVPALHTRLAGAHNVVIDSGGLENTHSELPGSPLARREAALAIHGLAPTCQSLADMMVDHATTQAISTGSDLVGLGVWTLGRQLDAAIPPTLADLSAAVLSRRTEVTP
ncbi:MAG: peptidoglycan DD-metalloendopeptidase family protein [Acidimicrobiales bacterium]